MPLTILTDEDVRKVLHSLTKEDILDLQQSLADALHYYSTSVEDNGCCSSYQPMRTSLKRKDGSTTLFMPASSSDGLGVKIVTLQAPEEPPAKALESLSLSSHRRSSSRTSLSASPSSTRSPSVAPSMPPSMSSAQSTTPRGSLTLFDETGTPSGLINAEELTAFRTALASSMLLKKRKNVHNLTVFGAGKQAYWHIRLALLLRGDEIHHVNVINRSFDRAREMLIQLYYPFPEDEDYVNPIGQKYGSKTKTALLTPAHGEYTRLLKEYVRDANVIFCTTPSTEPLFPASYLTNPEGRKKGRYIACIGSYKPHMIELHPDILRQAVAPHHEHRHFHKHQKEGGAVVVDSVEACLREAGEVVQAGLQPDEVVELGELVMLRREAEKKREEMRRSSEDGDREGLQVQDSSGLRGWLTKGNVVYKSVGLGLMDVVVGRDLVRLANERGVGTTIENF
ncbi:hypothetical protein M8818_001965 [Zalaria obscura]|uniref:Uncharacterized protein n=1 Tax=Zalaria obscura TaxID=2024903 RepID=A0ACC3SJN5_9PEZI